MGAASVAVGGCAANFGGSTPETTATVGDLKPASASRPQKPVRIAMLLPLSGFGAAAVQAKGMKQAGELALFEIDNPLVQLIVKDDKGTPVGAAAAAAEALAEGAEIIVGPMTAQGTSAVAPIAKAKGVPVLSFSNDRRVAGNGVYLMSPLPEREIERIVTFTAKQGKKRFAALIPDDAYGAVIDPAFRAAVTGANANLSIMVRYPLDPTALMAPVRQVAEEVRASQQTDRPIDVLLVAGGPDVLDQTGPVLSYAGIDPARVKIIGTGAWEAPHAGRNAVFVGGWYPGPDPHGWQDFSQRFSKSFGTSPPRLASLSYDAVSLAIALSGYEPGERYTVANLTRAAGFQGVAGLTRFTEAGLAERGLAVLELQSFGSSVADPSPSAPATGGVFSAAQAGKP